MTHGGDGLFLWAGQSTMDTGKGGSNDNVFYGNDFSHAVANGIEATFSAATSSSRTGSRSAGTASGAATATTTLIADNRFAGNTDAIAIEHGQRQLHRREYVRRR